ncbi:MAG: hypothetical protein H6724_08480 [Sandaracinus sp.]|nr:hypothetical protein [Sandaracinus sp.]
MPALPGADARVASAIYAATGDANAAGRVLDAAPADVVSASSSLPAIVLGHLDRTLHHREPLRGVTPTTRSVASASSACTCRATLRPPRSEDE